MPDHDTQESRRNEGHSASAGEVPLLPPRDLAGWQEVWERDHRFPIRSHRRWIGWLLGLVKRLLRPLVKAPVADLWDRERAFNHQVTARLQELVGQVQRQAELIDRQVQALSSMEAEQRELRSDLERYRHEARELRSTLSAALAAAPPGGTPSLGEALSQQEYVEFEHRFRGSREEIQRRVDAYLPYLEGRGRVLDVGCGRGEALEVLQRAGISACGVDSNRAMVSHCRERGLEVVEGDLLSHLAEREADSLGGILALHVVEHLPLEAQERLVRLARRALFEGGALIVETPNPLSLVISARNFWLDPTHVKPVHPARLELLFEQAGFDSIERLELRPFSPEERLPEVEPGADESSPPWQQLKELRDRLDTLLFGCQDYAVVGVK